jgi:hypothetical protein
MGNGEMPVSGKVGSVRDAAPYCQSTSETLAGTERTRELSGLPASVRTRAAQALVGLFELGGGASSESESPMTQRRGNRGPV